MKKVDKTFFIVFFIHAMEVNGNPNGLLANILQNICFYVPQNKENHSGLEWHEGE